MQGQKTFGRKVPARQWVMPSRAMPRPASVPPAETPLPALSDLVPPDPRDDVDAELEQWKALRKAKRRSFREPWRTTSIVAGVGFGLSTWLLPDSVADIAELVSGGLALAAFLAGFRPQETPPDRPEVTGKAALPAKPAEAGE
jgi:hypothetical protein